MVTPERLGDAGPPRSILEIHWLHGGVRRFREAKRRHSRSRNGRLSIPTGSSYVGGTL